MKDKLKQIDEAIKAVKENELHTLEYGVAGCQHEKSYDSEDLIGKNETKTILIALTHLKETVERGDFMDNLIDECESQMSYSEHRKKVAAMDYHTSEEEHQSGRWHCANDIRKWAESYTQSETIKKFMKE